MFHQQDVRDDFEFCPFCGSDEIERDNVARFICSTDGCLMNEVFFDEVMK